MIDYDTLSVTQQCDDVMNTYDYYSRRSTSVETPTRKLFGCRYITQSYRLGE